MRAAGGFFHDAPGGVIDRVMLPPPVSLEASVFS